MSSGSGREECSCSNGRTAKHLKKSPLAAPRPRLSAPQFGHAGWGPSKRTGRPAFSAEMARCAATSSAADAEPEDPSHAPKTPAPPSADPQPSSHASGRAPYPAPLSNSLARPVIHRPVYAFFHETRSESRLLRRDFFLLLLPRSRDVFVLLHPNCEPAGGRARHPQRVGVDGARGAPTSFCPLCPLARLCGASSVVGCPGWSVGWLRATPRGGARWERGVGGAHVRIIAVFCVSLPRGRRRAAFCVGVGSVIAPECLMIAGRNHWEGLSVAPECHSRSGRWCLHRPVWKSERSKARSKTRTPAC